MTTARRLHFTYADYLAAQAMAEVRLEYFDGDIYAMAGGTPDHAAISAQVIAGLSSALHGRCLVFSSDLRIHIEASGLATYPDVSVVCGARELSPLDPNAVTNPTVVVEVTSPSTEDYDRGEKLSHYKRLPSLHAVLIVSHHQRRVTLHARETNGWSTKEFRSPEKFIVPGVEVQLGVDLFYGALVR